MFEEWLIKHHFKIRPDVKEKMWETIRQHDVILGIDVDANQVVSVRVMMYNGGSPSRDYVKHKLAVYKF